jgi:hypothetical protein
LCAHPNLSFAISEDLESEICPTEPDGYQIANHSISDLSGERQPNITGRYFGNTAIIAFRHGFATN